MTFFSLQQISKKKKTNNGFYLSLSVCVVSFFFWRSKTKNKTVGKEEEEPFCFFWKE
jgi:hypothetical protein